MAAVGRPDRVQFVDVAGAELAANWYWEWPAPFSKTGMTTLVSKGGGWQVESVVW